MSDPIPFTATATPVFLEGNAVRLEGTFTTFAGDPVAVSSIRLLVQPPDGLSPSLIPLSDESGTAVGTTVLNRPGLWVFRFEGVSPVHVAIETRVVVTPRGVAPVT